MTRLVTEEMPRQQRQEVPQDSSRPEEEEEEEEKEEEEEEEEGDDVERRGAEWSKLRGENDGLKLERDQLRSSIEELKAERRQERAAGAEHMAMAMAGAELVAVAERVLGCLDRLASMYAANESSVPRGLSGNAEFTRVAAWVSPVPACELAVERACGPAVEFGEQTAESGGGCSSSLSVISVAVPARSPRVTSSCGGEVDVALRIMQDEVERWMSTSRLAALSLEKVRGLEICRRERTKGRETKTETES